MRKKTIAELEDLIGPIIAEEQRAALTRFRASSFEAGIQERIDAIPPAERRRGIGAYLSPAGWGAVAGGLAACALLLAILLPPAAEKADIARSIERFLERNPEVLVQLSGTSGIGGGLDPAGNASSGLSAILAGIRGERNTSVEQKRIGPLVSGPFGRPLSLEEMYKILFIDMSIERVLALIS